MRINESLAAEDAQYGKGRRGGELPVELARRKSRLKKIAQAKAELEQEAREKAEREHAAAEAKLAARRRAMWPCGGLCKNVWGAWGARQ